MAEDDWAGLKAAMVTITGPYAQEEIGPPGPGRGNNTFGWSIAASGDRAVVGAPGDPDGGRAYVLERDSATGRWRQVARLRASDAADGDGFGTSVAILDDFIAVGAPYHDVAGLSDHGAVYLFARDSASGDWSQHIRPSDFVRFSADARLGASVAFGQTGFTGDLLIMGAPGARHVVAIVRVDATTWTHLRSLGAPGSADGFGHALAFDGSRLVVGAPQDSALGTNHGSAHLYSFRRVMGVPTWSYQGPLAPGSHGAAGGAFGHSVAVAGALIVVGQPRFGNGQGAVHTYAFDGGTGVWVQREVLRSANGGTSDQLFGWSLALSSTRLAVGAMHHDVGTDDSDHGAAFVYEAAGVGSWTSRDTRTGAMNGDRLGSSVAITGDTVLIGAYGAKAPDFRRGQVRVMRPSGSAWSESQAPIVAVGDDNQAFGSAVALSGGTAVVTAPQQPFGAGDGIGAANIYVRGPALGDWRWQAALPYPAKGNPTPTAVTIDGDTVIVGVPYQDVGSNVGQGSAYVYVRSGTTWNQQATLIDPSGRASDLLGWSVALSGNTAVIGAVGLNGDRGGAYVFTRAGSTWTLQQRVMAADGAASDLLGWSVSVSNNTAVLGAPGRSSSKGAAYVFGRSGAAWTHLTTLTAADGAAGDAFGTSVDVVGNAMLIGAPYKDSGMTGDAGAAYVYTGAGSSWTQQKVLTSLSPTTFGYFGYAVALSSRTAVVGEAGVADGVHMFRRSGTAWTLRGSAYGDDSDLGLSVGVSGSLVIAGAPVAGQPSIGSGSSAGGRAYVLADDSLFDDGFQGD